jgi:hypothetical protein
MRHSSKAPAETGKSVSIIQPPAERSRVRPWPSPCPPEIVLLNCDVKRGCCRFSVRGFPLTVRGRGDCLLESLLCFARAMNVSPLSHNEPRARVKRHRGSLEAVNRLVTSSYSTIRARVGSADNRFQQGLCRTGAPCHTTRSLPAWEPHLTQLDNCAQS